MSIPEDRVLRFFRFNRSLEVNPEIEFLSDFLKIFEESEWRASLRVHEGLKNLFEYFLGLLGAAEHVHVYFGDQLLDLLLDLGDFEWN